MGLTPIIAYLAIQQTSEPFLYNFLHATATWNIIIIKIMPFANPAIIHGKKIILNDW